MQETFGITNGGRGIMGDFLARVLIYGDMHTSSKNYGGHRYYAEETLEYFTNITNAAEEYKATHLIGLGDFSFGRYHNLEYRLKIEEQLEKQYRLTNGRRWELKGNHDSATYGMTEYEFYVQKGLIKPAENINIENVNISMINYGEHLKTPIIPPDKDMVNIVLAHDYFKFSNTQLPNYGNAIELDYFEPWYGIDILVVGHIHNYERFHGSIKKNGAGVGKEVIVVYPGCMSRPAYREGNMPETGKLISITIFNDLSVDFGEIDLSLWPLNKSFNLDLRLEQESKKEYKIDVSDIVRRIDSHERVVGNPEDIIMAMGNVELKYREKAIELLKEGNR